MNFEQPTCVLCVWCKCVRKCVYTIGDEMAVSCSPQHRAKLGTRFVRLKDGSRQTYPPKRAAVKSRNLYRPQVTDLSSLRCNLVCKYTRKREFGKSTSRTRRLHSTSPPPDIWPNMMGIIRPTLRHRRRSFVGYKLGALRELAKLGAEFTTRCELICRWIMERSNLS